MSALGHKRTFRSAIAMSALPPKADILLGRYVRFGPKAEAEVSSDQGLHTVDPDKGS